MHRQSRFNKIAIRKILFTLFVIVTISCQNKTSIESIVPQATPIVTRIPFVEYQSCFEGYSATEDCLVTDSPSYSYTQEYGGRATDGTDITVGTAAENTSFVVVGTTNLVVTIASGYYSGNSIIINQADNNLVGTNIVSGVTLFGITGVMPSTGSYSNCSNSYPVLTGATLGLIAEVEAACATAGTFYYYDKAYGGRAAECSITTSTLASGVVNKLINGTGKCWYNITFGTYYFYDQPPSLQDCAPNSRVSTACIANASNYLYNQQFNGRSAVCVPGAVNTESCWIPSANYSIQSANYCAEVTSGSLETDGKNDGQCLTVGVGRYVYKTPFGDRGNTSTATPTNEGKQWFGTDLKSDIEVDLHPDKIKSGTVIFGVAGAYTGATFTWGSGIHHNSDGINDTRISYKNESITAATVTLNTTTATYYAVPRLSSSESTESITGGTVDRTSWGSITCGSTGSIANRESQCSTAIGSAATWYGGKKGNAGQGDWALVTRQNCSGSVCKEVWRDKSTDLLWSSLVSTWSNWCYASGSSNSSAVSDYHRDPNDLTCSSFLYQSVGSNNPMSACYEGAGYSPQGYGYFDITGGTAPDDGKTRLSASLAQNNGRVFWRLPTIYDYSLANHNGIRYVLPDIANDLNLWTATTYSVNRDQAWVFNQKYGYRTRSSKAYSNAVRCVGR